MQRLRSIGRRMYGALFGRRVSLALAGGGCKAFFALGVGHVLLRAGLPVSRISGTSAGSAMAMALISGTAEEVVRYFCAITLRNRSNFYLSRLILGKRPWPHERMYRSAVAGYTDFDRVRSSRIELAVNALRVPPEMYPPERRLQRYRLVTRIISAYRRELQLMEQGIYRPCMRPLAEEVGLEETVFSKEHLTTPRHVQDVVLAASSVPPLVRFQKLDDGNYYLDGGITNNLPISLLPREDLIVGVYYDDHHMTRYFYERTGDDVGRDIVYVCPERDLPIDVWDYANAAGVRETFEMGKRAGERALKKSATCYEAPARRSIRSSSASKSFASPLNRHMCTAPSYCMSSSALSLRADGRESCRSHCVRYASTSSRQAFMVSASRASNSPWLCAAMFANGQPRK